MSEGSRAITHAAWLSPSEAIVHLTKDWTDPRPPPLRLLHDNSVPENLRRASPWHFARTSGYYIDRRWLTFLIHPEDYPQIDFQESPVYVGGDFNGWDQAIGSETWRLDFARIGDRDYYLLNVEKERCLNGHSHMFKFVNGRGEWLPVREDAVNAVNDNKGNRNYQVDSEVTGMHIFQFDFPGGHGVTANVRIQWKEKDLVQVEPILPGDYILNCETDAPLGVRYEDGQTVFRVFAPRATEVTAIVYDNPEARDGRRIPLFRADDCLWHIAVPEDLQGLFYHLSVNSTALDSYSAFDPDDHVLDPYALASAGADGPGIIVFPSRIKQSDDGFAPPRWHDLVICEAHVRDLVRHAPIDLPEHERHGYAGLRKWVDSDAFYLADLGYNAVELLPVQETGDVYDKSEYHWGYMTVNYFAPESSYALEPHKASQIDELRELVEAFHRKGMAVILDVVYNHVGEPNALLRFDKFYYFDLDADGDLMNWSGCGNTLRCDTPMARRLIVDSLTHLVQAFGVDGFRFDLAELIGVQTLRHIETELKKVKPGIILIAEPWSFRGHILHALRNTGFASWNDAFREFLPNYVKGAGDREGIQFFLCGARGEYASFPCQTVNYVESHDDYAWIDRITENFGKSGHHPTDHDRRRTHLMVATLMSALGMPMLHAGMDMLLSKHGLHNTYRRPDINAIPYHRAREYPVTQEYFRQWIRFRLSEPGKLIRLESFPEDGYFRVFHDDQTTAIALMYNSDGLLGQQRLIFAINPHDHDVHINMHDTDLSQWKMLADSERFNAEGLGSPHYHAHQGLLILPAMSCGLWSLE